MIWCMYLGYCCWVTFSSIRVTHTWVDNNTDETLDRKWLYESLLLHFRFISSLDWGIIHNWSISISCLNSHLSAFYHWYQYSAAAIFLLQMHLLFLEEYQVHESGSHSQLPLQHPQLHFQWKLILTKKFTTSLDLVGSQARGIGAMLLVLDMIVP